MHLNQCEGMFWSIYIDCRTNLFSNSVLYIADIIIFMSGRCGEVKSIVIFCGGKSGIMNMVLPPSEKNP